MFQRRRLAFANKTGLAKEQIPQLLHAKQRPGRVRGILGFEADWQPLGRS
jgi:hypothetical protein